MLAILGKTNLGFRKNGGKNEHSMIEIAFTHSFQLFFNTENRLTTMHLLLVLLLLATVLGCTKAVKVAIVGAGIGAASTALHLRELIPDDLDIDV